MLNMQMKWCLQFNWILWWWKTSWKNVWQFLSIMKYYSVSFIKKKTAAFKASLLFLGDTFHFFFQLNLRNRFFKYKKTIIVFHRYPKYLWHQKDANEGKIVSRSKTRIKKERFKTNWKGLVIKLCSILKKKRRRRRRKIN